MYIHWSGQCIHTLSRTVNIHFFYDARYTCATAKIGTFPCNLSWFLGSQAHSCLEKASTPQLESGLPSILSEVSRKSPCVLSMQRVSAILCIYWLDLLNVRHIIGHQLSCSCAHAHVPKFERQKYSDQRAGLPMCIFANIRATCVKRRRPDESWRRRGRLSMSTGCLSLKPICSYEST